MLLLQVKETMISEKEIQEMWVSFPKPILLTKNGKKLFKIYTSIWMLMEKYY